ncbi:MAG: DUF4173 domain-containing protein [Oscillospiraceae bacterium]|nr:DUF4173 domain-containing protein [Oscillospiraceae bacterium]
MENNNFNYMENSNAGYAAPTYNAGEYRPQIVREYSRREVCFAFAGLVLGFMFIKLMAAPVLARGNAFGLGAAVTLLAATAYCTLFTAQRNKITAAKAIRVALCIAFSVNVFVNSNTLIQFLDIVFVLLTLAYDKLADSDGKFNIGRRLFPADMMTALLRPFAEMPAQPAAIKQSVSKTKGGKTLGNILLGLVIAIPSTVIVCNLLMSADEGFSEIMESFFDNIAENAVVFLIQAAISLPVGCYIFGMCIKGMEKSNADSDENALRNIRGLRIIPAFAGAASAAPVCVMYVIFFFSQASYFLSAFASRLPADAVSYSEYARRGFFELCTVAVINLIIIIGINLFCKYNDDGSRPGCIKIISCIVSIFTLLLIATAVSKMAMYINVYGLTPLRVYTTWFMLLLAVIFLGIFLSLITVKVNLPKLSVIAFTVMFSALSFVNVEGMIVSVNADRYLAGTLENFDLELIEEMSAGAIPAACKLRGKLSKYSENEKLEDIIRQKVARAETGDMRSLTLSDILAEIAAKFAAKFAAENAAENV